MGLDLRIPVFDFLLNAAIAVGTLRVIELLRFGSLLAQAGGDPFGVSMLFLPASIFLMYWLLIARPQKREMQTKAEMLKNLKKNDHVITTSGIYGVVTSVRLESNEVTLRVDDTSNTKLRMTLTSISRVAPSGEEAKEGS